MSTSSPFLKPSTFSIDFYSKSVRSFLPFLILLIVLSNSGSKGTKSLSPNFCMNQWCLKFSKNIGNKCQNSKSKAQTNKQKLIKVQEKHLVSILTQIVSSPTKVLKTYQLFRVYVMIMLCNFYPQVYGPTSNIVC